MKRIILVILCTLLIVGCTKVSDSNPYFVDTSTCVYKGDFLFDDIVEKDVSLNINLVADLQGRKLYEIKLDNIEGVPNDRLYIGCFLVSKDRIYKINPTDENINALKSDGKIPNDSIVVCQEDALKDDLSADEPGWHQSIVVKENQREYHSYNNQVETGYYESFIWEKGKGLIEYQSGYGADSNSINLELVND